MNTAAHTLHGAAIAMAAWGKAEGVYHCGDSLGLPDVPNAGCSLCTMGAITFAVTGLSDPTFVKPVEHEAIDDAFEALYYYLHARESSYVRPGEPGRTIIAWSDDTPAEQVISTLHAAAAHAAGQGTLAL